ncbi:MAG: hypothetical protein K6U74_14175 [Firmicutes bacterium]|nr:hypothetical protein [Bacillota bacterium]
MENKLNQQGQLIFEQLKKILENIQKFRDMPGDETYQSFLHGQAAGLVLALKIMFPGDGNIGEQASYLASSVMGEHQCSCHDHDHDRAQEEDSPGM